MMALVGDGGYNSEEHKYTESFKTYEERKQATKKRIIQHLKDYTPSGFAEHMIEKSNSTWAKSKYTVPGLWRRADNQAAVDFIAHSRLFNLYCDSVHLSLLTLMLMSFISLIFTASRQTASTPRFLIALAIFGLLLFLLIWETKARYIVHFYNIFIVHACFAHSRTE